MRFYYTAIDGDGRTDRKTTQYGFLTSTETGTDEAVFLDLQFRLATNGVIVNTLVNETPVITTGAALFH